MKYRVRVLIVIAALWITVGQSTYAQPDRWQQEAKYTMAIDMDVKTHRYQGNQELIYTNNSPDTLTKVFYHLYFNAFQPGSMMDVRSRNITDPDARVGSRISQLKENEIGYLRVKSLTHNENDVSYQEVGTILEVTLSDPILPNSKATFNMDFEGQVPVQIRRSGRDNKEGISYSMAQWYPKLSEYDYEGWHSNPYIGREFHGVWGDFDVKITIDPTFVVASTGYLQNPNEIGHGYEEKGQVVKRPDGNLTWHFVAPDVIDFVWAADPDYTHLRHKMEDGPELHFFYESDEVTQPNWEKLPELTAQAFTYMNENFGKYPYEQYSVIQGGDGGMEYPMATLILGRGSMRGLLGVTVHELIHSWFQGVLASNESLYPWMDEGFTSYATAKTIKHLRDPNSNRNPFNGSYMSYFGLVKSGAEEPMTTHSDHYNENKSYGTAAYSKGSIVLNQLSYVIGEETLMRGMRRYFNTWKMKHPNVTDFKRIMEKESGLELDWYFEGFVNTTKTIDYGITKVESAQNSTKVVLERVGQMPMPVDLVVEYVDGTKEIFYIPLRVMRGEKSDEDSGQKRTVLEDWPWTYPQWEIGIPRDVSEIRSLEIDPSKRMADLNRDNNFFKVDAKLSGSTERKK